MGVSGQHSSSTVNRTTSTHTNMVAPPPLSTVLLEGGKTSQEDGEEQESKSYRPDQHHMWAMGQATSTSEACDICAMHAHDKSVSVMNRSLHLPEWLGEVRTQLRSHYAGLGSISSAQ